MPLLLLNMTQFLLPKKLWMKSLYIKSKRANALKSDLCLLKKQLCRWNFWITVSLYSETILQSLLMLYIREKTVPSVLLNPNNMKNIKERQCLSFYFALNLYNFFKNIDFNKNAVIIVLGFCLKPYFLLKL